MILKKRARTRSKDGRRQKKIDEKEKPIVVLLFKAEQKEKEGRREESRAFYKQAADLMLKLK